MSQDKRRIAFLKVLIAAAWADEKLSPAEIRTLSYYLQRFRVTEQEYELLRPLLERPIPRDRAQAILESQLAVLTGSEEQRTLVAAVEDLLAADDTLAPPEASFLRELRKLTHNPPTAQVFITQLKTLWTDSATPAQADPVMEQFLQRRLLEYFRSRIALTRARSGMSIDSDEIPDHDLYRTVILAGLLGRVAAASSMRPPEKDQLLDVLRNMGQLPDGDLDVVAGASLDGSLSGIEIGTLVKEFLKVASPEEAGMLLDSLFLVAAADGRLQHDEVDVIREIAHGAGFSQSAFEASLDRCRRRMELGWN
jgi:uncharacterized tellurite resistance protein B-like protein